MNWKHPNGGLRAHWDHLPTLGQLGQLESFSDLPMDVDGTLEFQHDCFLGMGELFKQCIHLGPEE